MRACPKCHHLNQDKAEFCTNCGYRLIDGPLAIECPHCGKLCALGTIFCPVCHHRLPEAHHQPLQAPVKKPVVNSRLLKILAGIGILFLAAFMTYNLKIGTVKQTNAPYTVVCLNYLDHHHHFRYAQYYIVKQNISAKSQYKFTMAYMGQGNPALKRSANNDIRVVRKKFYSYPHYHMVVRKHTTYLSGPQRAQITLTASELSHNKQKQGQSRFPAFKNKQFHCRVPANPRIGYVNFGAPVANVNDS